MEEEKTIEKEERKRISLTILLKLIPKIAKEIIIILIGLIIFSFNIGWVIHSITYTETTATIYKVRYDWKLKSYRPIYEYKHKNGKKYRVLGNIVGEEKEFTIGDKVHIMYNPKNYKKIDEGSKKDSAFAWAICIICLVIPSISFYFIMKKYKKYKENNWQFNVKDENIVEEEQDKSQK